VITVNQRDTVTWHEGMTVTDLLGAMKFTYPHIIVAIDGNLVPYDGYDHTLVPDGADVRVIHIQAGG